MSYEGFTLCPTVSLDVSYAPTSLDPCIAKGNGPCSLYSKASVLEKAIDDAKQVLLDLMAQHEKLMVEVNGYHDHFRRLPVEVISQIFEHSYPPPPVLYDGIQELQLDPEEFPLVLGHVCHYWREIAWSIPRLWTKIYLYPGYDTYDHEDKIDVVNEWIDRTSHLPLSITVKMPNDEESDSPDDVDPYLDIICQHSRRWRTVEFYGTPRAFRYLFDEEDEPPAEVLRYLGIELISNRGTDERLYFIPNAEHLQLRNINDYRVKTSWNVDPPFFESVMICRDMDFDRTDAPSSRTLEIQDKHTSPLGVHLDYAMPDFISQQCSHSHITAFSISGFVIDNQMVSLLQLFQNLSCLKILRPEPMTEVEDMRHRRYPVVCPSFWCFLQSRIFDRESKLFLPRLEHLEYEGFSSFEKWSTILELCKTTYDYNVSLGGPFSRLKTLKIKLDREESMPRETADAFRELNAGDASINIIYVNDQGLVVDLLEESIDN